MAVDLVGLQSVKHLNRIFQSYNFATSSDFKLALSALNRSGHARFRRGPSPSTPADLHTPINSLHSENQIKEPLPPPPPYKKHSSMRGVTETTSSFQSMTSSFESSFPVGNLEGSISNGKKFGNVEGSVSDGKLLSSLGIVAPALSFSSRKPPLPSSNRKRRSGECPSASLQGSGRESHSVSRTACHCCKRRKTGSKREVKIIPIIGSKVESIPADDYSWKKYGEKKVDGSSLPRVYYKCNSAKECPARKRVELSPTDSKMLIITYDGEHRHRHRQTPTPVPTSFSGLQIK